jgi:hypothetical protein
LRAFHLETQRADLRVRAKNPLKKFLSN